MNPSPAEAYGYRWSFIRKEGMKVRFSFLWGHLLNDQIRHSILRGERRSPRICGIDAIDNLGALGEVTYAVLGVQIPGETRVAIRNKRSIATCTQINVFSQLLD